MCKALEDLYNDGIEQGIEQGIECGIERGIEQGIKCGMELGIVRGMIETLKDLGIEKNHVIVRVMEKFGITQEEAENDVEKYWA